MGLAGDNACCRWGIVCKKSRIHDSFLFDLLFTYFQRIGGCFGVECYMKHACGLS